MGFFMALKNVIRSVLFDGGLWAIFENIIFAKLFLDHRKHNQKLQFSIDTWNMYDLNLNCACSFSVI